MIDYTKILNEKFSQYEKTVQGLSANTKNNSKLTPSHLTTYNCIMKLLDATSPFSHKQSSSTSSMFALFSTTNTANQGELNKKYALKAAKQLRSSCFENACNLHQKNELALKASKALTQQTKISQPNTELIKSSATVLKEHADYLQQLVQTTDYTQTTVPNVKPNALVVDSINQSLRKAKVKASLLGMDPNTAQEKDIKPLEENLQNFMKSQQKQRENLQKNLPGQQLADIHNELQNLQDFNVRASLAKPSLLSSDTPFIADEYLKEIDSKYQKKYVTPLQSCGEKLQDMRQRVENINLPNCQQSPSLIPSIASYNLQVITGNLTETLCSQLSLDDLSQNKLASAHDNFQKITQCQNDYRSDMMNKLANNGGLQDRVSSVAAYQDQLRSIQNNLPNRVAVPDSSSSVINRMHDAVGKESQANENFFNSNKVSSLNDKLQKMSQTTESFIPVPALDTVKNQIAALKDHFVSPNITSEGSGKEMVVSLATTTCSYGVGVSSIEALPKLVTINEQPVLTVVEYAPFVNLLPYPSCISPNHPLAKAGIPPPFPCMPIVAAPWEQGTEQTKTCAMSLVTNSCSCDCTFAEGKISFIQAGQVACTAN